MLLSLFHMCRTISDYPESSACRSSVCGSGVDRMKFWPSIAKCCLFKWCTHAWSICLQGLGRIVSKTFYSVFEAALPNINNSIYNGVSRVGKTGGTDGELNSSQISKVRCCKCGTIVSILCSFSSCKSVSLWFLYWTVLVLKTAQDLSLELFPHPRSSFARSSWNGDFKKSPHGPLFPPYMVLLW